MSSPYHFLNKFNSLILPITAPFLSGYILGYMVSDIDSHNKFQKYKPIHIKEAPLHNFYVYTHNDADLNDCVEILEKHRSA